MTKEAVQRLKAIKEFTTLGSGYQIALRDVEIRGVGNILGTKQHGHMINVGFDTYCDLLEEAVQEIRDANYIGDTYPMYCVLPENINENMSLESFITLNESLNKTRLSLISSKEFDIEDWKMSNEAKN